MNDVETVEDSIIKSKQIRETRKMRKRRRRRKENIIKRIN